MNGREVWFVYGGRLLVGQDIFWELSQVRGHDRHQWVMDEWELGREAAGALHMENRWVGGAVDMVAYYDRMVRVDVWLASPEGQAAMDAGRTELLGG